MELSTANVFSSQVPPPSGRGNATPYQDAEEVPLLIFRLQTSLFAVPALAVREIVSLPDLSPLAETAPFVLGVLNLRGAIVPVMDLNARLGRDSPPPRLEDALIVLDCNGALVSILANEVRAVSPISRAQIEAPPLHSRSPDLAQPFIAGVLREAEGIVMLLHLPHLLGTDATTSRALSTLAATQFAPAPRFESQFWTPEERTILQARALRLRSGLDTESTKNQEEALAPDEMRAPVAVVALGGEEFGVALEMVREFATVSAVARVPCCPPHILGQINLRGEIVTLIDARPALRTARTAPPFFPPPGAGLKAITAPRAHPVVVVSHGDGAVGIVVDDVRDVLYPREELAPDAAIGDVSGARFFTGSTPYQGRLLPLLDVAQLLEEGHLNVEEGV